MDLDDEDVGKFGRLLLKGVELVVGAMLLLLLLLLPRVGLGDTTT